MVAVKKTIVLRNLSAGLKADFLLIRLLARDFDIVRTMNPPAQEILMTALRASFETESATAENHAARRPVRPGAVKGLFPGLRWRAGVPLICPG